MSELRKLRRSLGLQPAATSLYRVKRERQIHVEGRTIDVVEIVAAHSKPDNTVQKLHPTKGWRQA